jgi:CDP-glycerol glycerophosphotransferase
MRRYLDTGVVSREAAVLVGYPKVDALVNGGYDMADVRRQLRLEGNRPTAIYAPTWSTASSLNIGGEAIVQSLVDAGFNVVVKLHDRSLDAANALYSGGIDWRARFAAMRQPGRIAFSEAADSSPLLAASDVMVTDHSSIGFEFYLLDRPLIVVDAPDLVRVARINPEKVALLRSAARVVERPADAGPAALDELAHRDRRSPERRAVVREMFHAPGTATARALEMVYDLLEVTPHARHAPSHAVETAGSVS